VSDSELIIGEGAAPPQPPAIVHPVCPHCGADPMHVMFLGYAIQTQQGREMWQICFCANPDCRKALNMQFRGAEQPRIMPVGSMPGPRIVPAS
jgi:hypothetical protein